MNLRIITASAGSGKTTRLSHVLEEAVRAGAARPEAIVAMTFTREAAAELIERARVRLLGAGLARDAHRLLAARVGTVHSVCGGLVAELALELGLSPELRVLDENAAELEQKRALAAVISPAVADELQGFQRRFDMQLDWSFELRAIIEAARANGLGPPELARSAARSIETLDAALGPAARGGAALDAGLAAALDGALAAIGPAGDGTKVTNEYLELLREGLRNLSRLALRWGDWAKLASSKPGVRSARAAAPVAAAALRHVEHPRLRADLARLIELLFHTAADGLAAYQEHKRRHGVIDFIDQEALALALLQRPEVRDALAGQIDLVLIDEFQDTSPLQLAIFLELAALARESVWVGDQKQAIYGFRGTDPALMDAVIESLTATSTDPELVRELVETVAPTSRLETLSVSHRSRPALVALTNAIFAPAFARQDIPEERTRLSCALVSEPDGLGPIVEHWPLHCDERASAPRRAACLATGIRDLLADPPRVRDRATGAARPATAGDLAVLCRTNEQCQLVAEALGERGVPAVVPRMRLLDTVEGQLSLAGLRLWLDPRDAVAAAEIARIVAYPRDADAFVARALAAPGHAFVDDPTVAAIAAARAATPDLDPLAALDAITDAAGLRGLCAAWGESAQRLANLDALRAHAVSYVARAQAGRDPATLVGLLRHLDELAAEWSFRAARVDRQAVCESDDAVTISTWHRAKGRDWPITILYGLESLRPSVAYGLHVASDATRFDVARPLAGRWLRYWPNPYTTANQNGPARVRLEATPAFADIRARADREALRLLYVGWTRARDLLILAADAGKLDGGLFGILDASLFHEPPAGGAVAWGGCRVAVRVRQVRAADAAPRPVEAGAILVGRAPSVYPPALRPPSSAPAVPCSLAAPISLGGALPIRAGADMTLVGRAVHGFLAADGAELDDDLRRGLATALLDRFGVAGHVAAADLVAAATRLWRWIDATLSPVRLHREWPVSEVLPDGSRVSGAADLVVRRSDGGVVILDHKTFVGQVERARAYSGQLAMYRHAIGAALGGPSITTFVHLPAAGVVVEVRC